MKPARLLLPPKSSGMGPFPAGVHLLPTFSSQVDTLHLPMRLGRALGCGWGLVTLCGSHRVSKSLPMFLFLPVR